MCIDGENNGELHGIMWERKLEKRLKHKVLDICVVPTYVYGLGRLALTERQG